MLELKACATIPHVKPVIRHICVKGWGGERERETERERDRDRETDRDRDRETDRDRDRETERDTGRETERGKLGMRKHETQ